MTFHRPKLASDMADQLLQPKGLMKKIRSGLFMGDCDGSERRPLFEAT